MNIDDVVTLTSGKKFLLLDKKNYKGIDYFYAVDVKDEESAPGEDYAILKKTEENGKLFIESETNEEIIGYLLVVFMTNLSNELNNTIKTS